MRGEHGVFLGSKLCYNDSVHNSHYASGFLFHSPSQQILLLQPVLDSDTPWSIIRVSHASSDDPLSVFTSHASRLLKVTQLNVRPVYSYVDKKSQCQHSIFFADVTTRQNYPETTTFRYRWFELKDLRKLRMNDSIRHDIVVGTRVIAAGEREKEDSKSESKRPVRSTHRHARRRS